MVEVRYILTLNKVKRSDLEEAGFRAVDLAVLREKRLNIPLTFVINNQAFKDFLEENGLASRLENVFQKRNPADAYKEVLELFLKAELPRDVESELFEAYESLAIDPGVSASSIVTDWSQPFVSLIRSPSYLLSTEDKEGIFQNIRGKKALVDALKLVWASIYSPESLKYRERTGINDSFGVGVLVQKMKRVTQSAVSYSCSDLDKKTIIVKSFFGLQDYASEHEILGKDYHEVDVDTLMIKKADINVQEYSLIRDPESFEVVRHELGEQGSRQKLNDKQIAEVARITKRARSFIGKDLKLYLGVRDNYTYVLLANRVVDEQKKIIEEKDKMLLGVDEKGGHIIEHAHEVLGGLEEEPSLNMPGIISEEEARKEIVEERGVNEEVGIDEELRKDLEFLDEIEKEEEAKKQAEQGGGREVDLLEEVTKIKEVVERMEEHAFNKNKEAYEQEARNLRSMLRAITESVKEEE